MSKNRKWPVEGFLWGAATSAHQVEGNTDNDWTDWGSLPGRVAMEPADVAASDHYRRYEEDFALARQLGHNAHRLSLEWSRLEPEEGRWDMAEAVHYRQVLLSLRACGLEPMVTCWHFTLPRWLAAKGGWEHPEAPRLFARYCGFVAREFGDLVELWLTINEPMVYLDMGYFKGTWPPGRRGAFMAAWRVLRAMGRGHRAAYAAMHDARRGSARPCRVGVAQNCPSFEPYRRSAPLDRLAAGLATFVTCDLFLLITGRTHDFLGLNYYFHNRVSLALRSPGSLFLQVHPGVGPFSDLGWEIWPDGFYRALRKLGRRRLPLYVTENGVASADDRVRPAFLRDMTSALRRAVEAGVDVRGYFHWSLLDNLEWEKGNAPRFGLVAIDYATQRRTPRPSAYVFKEICESGSLTPRSE